jgi:phage-related protein
MRLMQSGDFYPAGYQGAVVRLVEIITNAATHYFGEQEVTYNGNTYSAFLIADSPYKRYRSLQADAGDIKLANTDDAMEALLTSEQFEGAKCKLLEYFPDLDTPDACELGRGVLSEQAAGEDVVTWRMIPEFDFTGIAAPDRTFSTTCTWRFKSDPCGYQDGVDPDDPETSLPFVACSKDFAACTARGRTHRFNGFIQITRTLTAVYPPADAGGAGGYGGRPPGIGSLPWEPRVY